MSTRLYRSSSNKVIAGICGGFGEHFDVDPTLVRLIAVVGALASFGIVLVFYLLAWIIIPQPPLGQSPVESAVPGSPAISSPRTGWRVYLPGLILVSIGVILLLREYVYWFQWHDVWPVLLVVLGLMLILRNGHRPGPGQWHKRTPSDGPDTVGRDGGTRP